VKIVAALLALLGPRSGCALHSLSVHRNVMVGRGTPCPMKVAFVATSVEVGDGGGARKTTFSRRRSGGGGGDDDGLLTYGDVVSLWRESAAFRDVFLSTLRDQPFEAFFWETPPVTHVNLDRPYEHVVVDAPSLVGVAPEPQVFAEHLRLTSTAPPTSVATFLNLGADATLVAPRESEQLAGHGAHFAAFLRGAPTRQAHELLAAVGIAVDARVGVRPLWVSTSGSGVAWLHVRLDSKPKYYTFAPYARWPQQ